MSAVAIAVGEDGIIAACDGVSYDYQTGNVGHYVSKLIVMPEYGCFIAATGMGSFGAALRWEIEQAINSFDDLVDGFERFAKWTYLKMVLSQYDGDASGQDAEMSCVIGGWSERRRRYEAWRLVSYQKPSVRLEDGKPVEYQLERFVKEELPAAIWCSHMPDAAGAFGINPPPADMETAEVLARLICACRAGSGFFEEDDGPGRHYNVGGFLQMAVIQRDRVESWVAHRWAEDEIGRPVDPSKGDPVVSWQMAA